MTVLAPPPPPVYLARRASAPINLSLYLSSYTLAIGYLITILKFEEKKPFWLSHLKSALNSSVVSVATTVGDRLFQWGIVLGGKEYFRASCNHVSGTPFMENSTICARNNILS